MLEVIFIDTRNEDEDTLQKFMRDCENWYQLPIETITSDKHEINSKPYGLKIKCLNTATGGLLVVVS